MLQSNGNRSTLDVLTLSVVMAAAQDRATAISLYTPRLLRPGSQLVSQTATYMHAPIPARCQ
jgi:hypothetical protein